MPALRALLLAALAALAAMPAAACVGDACLQVVSTEAGGGALAVRWRQAAPIQTFRAVCAAGECLFSTIDPGFIAAEEESEGEYVLPDGVRVRVEIVAVDPAATLRLNGVGLDTPGESGLLGTAPDIHSHPAWQVRVAEDAVGDYAITFRLTSDDARFAASAPFAVTLTNRPVAQSPTPTATATATPRPCAGDCDGSGQVTIDEMVRGVGAALGSGAGCAALDADGDGEITIGELVGAVAAALSGCGAPPTPTAVPFAMLQAAIFAPRCALPTCHDAASAAGEMVLTAGQAWQALVGVPPVIDGAREAGMLRVDPGQPDNSFLLVKLTGPPLGQGGRMPLAAAPLSAEEIETIRTWIAAGAAP